MLDHRLKHVVAVGRKGSFTGAAEVVGVTQSAVTKSVADLERELGYPIFLRTSRGALPTEDGQDFLERATRLLEDAQDLVGRPRRATEKTTEVLRIGIYPASLEWRLVDPLATLRSRYPSVRFKIGAASQERVVQQLRNRGIDVALGSTKLFNDPEEFKCYPVGDLQPVMFVRRGHPLLTNANVTLVDLAQYEMVCPSSAMPYAAVIREVYEARGLSSQHFVHVVDYCPIMRNLVLTSDAVGVATISPKIATADGELAVLDYLDLWQPQPMSLAIRANWRPSVAARAFINQTCYPDVSFAIA
ncbi:LysR family transcriptional regulator [Sphingobium sp. HWE2-09]|uniref:LysR family transcriptional regulator n=1 Tax=Sphingobium sp. HWE2-09 TaxID=3108390 RepID=UPI002DC54DDD|nr:LysR family transcriptional regulator [Sphingobium sp. HWE2-09]